MKWVPKQKSTETRNDDGTTITVVCIATTAFLMNLLCVLTSLVLA